jgi:hypothetical protein
MKKPINVEKLTGKQLMVATPNGYTFVLMVTLGADTDPNITTLFINPFEIYSACQVDNTYYDGPFLKEKLPQVWTADRGYEFSLEPNDTANRGLVDWEQTHCIVMEVNWNRQIIKSVMALVGDGTKGRALTPQMKFSDTAASSLDRFGESILRDYLHDLASYLEEMISQSKARVIGLKELTPVTV